MPDDRTTGRTLAKEAVTTSQATSQGSADLVVQQAKAAERLQIQAIDPFHRLAEETVRVAQDLTDRAVYNINVWIHLSQAAVSGWEQAATILSHQTQQTLEHQTRAVNEALRVQRPEQLIELHSRWLTDSLQVQFRTTAHLTQITAELTRQAAQRLPAQP